MENMMKKILLIILITKTLLTFTYADCSLDHFGIGRNPDGVNGTADDNKLFVDVTHIYRHTDPEHTGDPTWLNWYYPMLYDDWFEEYYISEPGFEVIENDPNRQLIGIKNDDYKITVKCVSITNGFIARNLTENIYLGNPGDSFCHSELSYDHIHLEYIYPWPAGANEPNEPLWITYQVCDTLEDGDVYEASNEFTLVFLNAPISGDIVVDHSVDLLDLKKLAGAWLSSSNDLLFNAYGQAAIDCFDRADINRDYHVNFIDFCLLAQHWQQQQP